MRLLPRPAGPGPGHRPDQFQKEAICRTPDKIPSRSGVIMARPSRFRASRPCCGCAIMSSLQPPGTVRGPRPACVRGREPGAAARTGPARQGPGQDTAEQVVNVGPGLEPELGGQPAAQRTEDAERLERPSGHQQRVHQLGSGLLAARLGRSAGPQAGQRLPVPAQPQLQVREVMPGDVPLLEQPDGLGVDLRHGRQAGDGRGPPAAEGLSEHGRRGGQVPAAGGRGGLRAEPAEPVQVHDPGPGSCLVQASAGGDSRPRPHGPRGPRRAPAQRADRVRRARHRPTAQRAAGPAGTAAPRTGTAHSAGSARGGDRYRPAGRDDLERPQHAELGGRPGRPGRRGSRGRQARYPVMPDTMTRRTGRRESPAADSGAGKPQRPAGSYLRAISCGGASPAG